jgi:hypothetical protein
MSYMTLENSVFDRSIALRDAYVILASFIAQYHERGESSTIDLLTDISLGNDGTPLDPAQIHDFLRVAGEVLGDKALLRAADEANS